MYELVKTKRQQKDFKKTLEYFRRTYGWSTDTSINKGTRYNLIIPRKRFYQKNRVIGTIEFTLYEPPSANSTVEQTSHFNFMQCNQIKEYPDNIWEIDKVCIQKCFQRQGYFQEIFEIIYEHATENKVNYYISFIELNFYRMLKLNFGTLIEKKGNAFVGSTVSLIPTLIHVGEYLAKQENRYIYQLK